MKKLQTLIASAVFLFTPAIAMAQLSFTVKAGATFTDVSMGKSIETDNYTGFTGGVMVEYMTPWSGFGVDAGVMYARRGEKTDVILNDENGVRLDVLKASRDYIEIPINVKWKWDLPGDLATPFFYTGPSLNFLVSNKEVIKNFDLKNKAFTAYWNIGVGVEFIEHIVVNLSYGLGMTDVLDGLKIDKIGLTSKDYLWTATLGYKF